MVFVCHRYLVKPQSSEEDEEEGHGRSLRHSRRAVRHRHRREDDDLVIANQHLSLTFSSETGRLVRQALISDIYSIEYINGRGVTQRARCRGTADGHVSQGRGCERACGSGLLLLQGSRRQ